MLIHNMIEKEMLSMQKPNRNAAARYKTVPQMMNETNLCRATVVRLAKEAGAYICVGRAVRVDSEKFFEYVGKEYRE